MKKPICFVIVCSLCQAVFASTWMVQPNGAGVASLWQALNQAQSGDEIVLADGVYRKSSSTSYVSNKDLTIRSLNGSQSCFIDCQKNGFLTMASNNSNHCTIQGLTLINAEDTSGAVFNLDHINLTLTDCVIRDCMATYYGGVIYANDSQITLDRCRFLSNRADFSGVIFGFTLELDATDCVFADNYADSYAGVIYYENSDATFTNCTFQNNRAGEVVGILYGVYGQTTLTNCIISKSFQYGFATQQTNSSDHLIMKNCLINGNDSPLYYNIVNGNSYSSAAALNGLSGCSGNLSGQPGFAQDTDTHITSASQAIDRGLTSAAGAFDLDGHARVLDGNGDGVATVDIGAYEYDPNAGCLIASEFLLDFIRDYNSPNPAAQTLTISNCGGAPIAWQARTTTDWLQVDPNAGTDQTGTLTVSVTTDGMDRGIYSDQIQLIDPNAVNSPLTIPVVLRIKGKLLVPQTYNSIQTAVNQAMPGEVVEVQAGIYPETVSVDKSLDLIGMGEPNVLGLIITADDGNITGFQCSGAGSAGVRLSGCAQTRLTDVTIRDCVTRGLSLTNCESCTLRNVEIINCAHGFSVSGSDPNNYRHDIDKSNTVDGKPIYYLTGVADEVIAGPLANPACLYLVDCADVVAFRLDLSGNGRAVCLVNTTNSTIRQVTVTDCESGVWLEDAANNALVNNSVSDCVNGIILRDSPGTHLQNNACRDNQANFTCTGSDDTAYDQDVDTTNTVDGKPIYYLVDQSNVTLDGDVTDVGCLYAVGCRNLSVGHQTLSHNGTGVVLINSSDVTLDSLIVRQNASAGLLLQDSTGISVTGSEISNNGMGVQIENDQDVLVDRSQIAYNGTGVFADYSQYTLLNCMIHHNTQNGGVRHYSYAADRAGIITQCTIFNNQMGNSSFPDNGGGITDSMDYLTIASSILWGNRPGQIPNASWQDYDVTYSDVETPLSGKGNISRDPGLTSDGHLTLNSPCIDVGLKPTGRRVGVDIDDETRVSGSEIDMGADEYIDKDFDGLPDWLERLVDPNAVGVNPDDDLDGDGYTNLEEYLYYDGAILTPVATYYVDPVHGDNDQNGLSVQTAKRDAGSVLSAMKNGERLILLPGTYTQPLAVNNKAITIEGQDPMNPQVTAATILTQTMSITGEDNLVISGLTFSCSDGNYGLYCQGSASLITHCRFTGNTGLAPVYCSNAQPHFSYCRFTRNMSFVGGLYGVGSTVIMDHCLIVENQENSYARALLFQNSDITVTNCTMAANVSDSLSPELAIYNLTTVPSILMMTCDLTVINSILWDSNSAIVDLDDVSSTASTVGITYSDLSETVDANWLGVGNLDSDPLFTAEGDYHLQSQAGRWDPTLSQWIQDAVTSPCIDAGDPNSSADQETQGDRINMGAYGGTAEASLAPAG